LSEFAGREVKSLGDGFLVTFDGPAQGVECAVQILRETNVLGIELWPAFIPARSGSRMMMSPASRLPSAPEWCRRPARTKCSSRKPCEILSRGSGLAFDDAGEHELKGLPDRWHLYRVT
jgi:hypothetical protein